MLSNDIVESLIRFLKQAFNEHSARGGGGKRLLGLPAAVARRHPLTRTPTPCGKYCSGFSCTFTFISTHMALFDRCLVFPGLH